MLTDRNEEIASLYEQTRSMRAVGRLLGISSMSVKYHLLKIERERHLMRSWDASSILAAIPPYGETRTATCASPTEARHFRLAIYNWLRARPEAPRLRIRISGCDVIIDHRPIARRPLRIAKDSACA